MFFTVEEERESIESEYFWHISLLLLFQWCKFRNYFRYLQILEQLFILSPLQSGFLLPSGHRVLKTRYAHISGRAERINETVDFGFYAEAYLLDVVSRYDIHGKKIFQSNEKIYWDDLGLRNLKAEGSIDSYIEKVIENAVYKHQYNPAPDTA